MKQLLIAGARRLVMMAACAGVLAWTGCKKSDDASGGASAPQASTDPIDMTRFKQAFASSDPSLRLFMEETVSLVRARVPGEARDHLNKMLKYPKLTAEQGQAIQEMLSKLDTLGAGRSR